MLLCGGEKILRKRSGGEKEMGKELRENRTPGAILLNMLIAAVSLFVNGFGIFVNCA